MPIFLGKKITLREDACLQKENGDKTHFTHPR